MPDPAALASANVMVSFLRDNGPWGLVVAESGIIGWLFKLWRDEATGRLVDQKDMAKVVEANSLAIQEQTRANEVRNEAFKLSVKSQEEAVIADRAQAALLLDLKNQIADLTKESGQIRNQLIARGAVAP